MAKHMTLREWLDKKSLSPEDFAAQIGRERTTIYRILKGNGYQPRLTTALAIQEATKGAVPLRSLVG